MQKIKGKKVLTFGDSIIDGHLYKKAGFINWISRQYTSSIIGIFFHTHTLLFCHKFHEPGLAGWF